MNFLEQDKGRLIIVGGGSLAMELVAWIINANIYKNVKSRLFFIDDKIKNDIYINNIKIQYLGKIKSIFPKNDDKFFLGIADPNIKSKVVHVLDEKKVNFCTFIHPTAIIAENAEIGRGCLLFPYSICSFNTKLKEFITVNLHTAIGHDVVINSFTTISSLVDLTGKVHIGKNVFIGSGARFLPSVRVGNCCKIGAGATVYHSVPSGKTAYTIPAKIL